jgi:hypothetical protein
MAAYGENLMATHSARTEHARTAAVGYGDACCRPYRLPPAGATVHSRVLDAELGTFMHRGFSGLGPSGDHRRIAPSGIEDRSYSSVAFDLVRVRVTAYA